MITAHTPSIGIALIFFSALAIIILNAYNIGLCRGRDIGRRDVCEELKRKFIADKNMHPEKAYEGDHYGWTEENEGRKSPSLLGRLNRCRQSIIASTVGTHGKTIVARKDGYIEKH